MTLGKMNILNTLAALFIIAASVEANEPPKEGADLQGTWQGVEVWDAKVKRDAESVKQLQIEFRRGKFVVRLGDEEFLSGRFSVDDKKNPQSLNLESVAQDGETSTIPAIYKIKKDGLSICHPNKKGGARPSAFKSSADVVLFTFSKASIEPAQQEGADQPATAPETKSEGDENPKSESKGRSQ